MLLTVSTFVNANTNAHINPITNIESPVDMPDGETLIIFIFYGELDTWTTPTGALIIDCKPPFSETCYTLWWITSTPSDKTVTLNDANQTEISVTSEPVITTGEDGTKTHTFTR